MKTTFFKSFANRLSVAACLLVLACFLTLSSCFTLSDQNPCNCAINNAAANTPSFDKALGQKCDEHESSLSESERAEWQRELSACMVGR